MIVGRAGCGRSRVDRRPELCGRGAALVVVGIRDIFRDKPDGGEVTSGSWVVTERVTEQVGATVWGVVVRCRRAPGRAGGRGTTVRGAGSVRGVPGWRRRRSARRCWTP